MTTGDPAVDAAQRAWDQRYPGGSVSLAASAYNDGLGTLALNVAREALKPLRQIHRPSRVVTADGRRWSECMHCYESTWPCDSARLIYADSELSAQ